MSSTKVWAELKREFPRPDGANSFHYYTSHELLSCGHRSSPLIGICGCPGNTWLTPVRCACGETQIWHGYCTGCKAAR